MARTRRPRDAGATFVFPQPLEVMPFPMRSPKARVHRALKLLLQGNFVRGLLDIDTSRACMWRVKTAANRVLSTSSKAVIPIDTGRELQVGIERIFS
jgi:hypothetical protein